MTENKKFSIIAFLITMDINAMIDYKNNTKELNGLIYRTIKIKSSEFIEADLFLNYQGTKKNV